MDEEEWVSIYGEIERRIMIKWVPSHLIFTNHFPLLIFNKFDNEQLEKFTNFIFQKL